MQAAAILQAQGKDILAYLQGDNPGVRRYGFRIKKNEPDPYHRVEYLYDAVGMRPAAVNLSTGEMDLGDWANIWFVRNNYPCMLNYDGTEAYKLDPNDYSKKLDGTDSDYNNLSFAGNAMSALPRCYVKRWENEIYEYVIICEMQFDESYHAYAHTDANGTI